MAPDGTAYPIQDGIPRFVPTENYADDFGAQWNRFARTQLDSHTGLLITRDRLNRCLAGQLDQLAGKLVLETGPGAGRFTEVLLAAGAEVHSFDYSSAVTANAANNGASSRLTLAQGDMRQPPYAAEAYDVVICLGVIQHTPSPKQSIAALWKMVKPGGRLFGEYQADVALGQNRIGIIWQKLTRPDGVQIELESPAADPLGQTGVKGRVNSHFFPRFGAAILQSALDIGVGLATRSATNGTVIVGLPGAVTSVQVPGQEPIKPTIKVRQGASVSVFVAKDLDFSTVEP